MPKTGQITSFLILGLVILALALLYFSSRIIDTTPSPTSTQFPIVSVQVESCLTKLGLQVIFDDLAFQGGQIDVTGEYEQFDDYRLPIYHSQTDLPTLNEIRQALEKDLLEKSEGCMDFSLLEKTGYTITKPATDRTQMSVSFNKDDTTLTLTYPLTVSTSEASQQLDKFTVTLPIRFKTVHSIADCYLAERSTNPSAKTDCVARYSSDDLILIYLLADKYVRVMDYKPFFSQYYQTLIFQFGV